MLDKINSNYSYLNPVVNNAEIANATSTSELQKKEDSYKLKHDSFERNTTRPDTHKVQSAQIPAQYYGLSPKILLRVFLDSEFIDSLAKKNPKVKEILDAHNIEYAPNPQNVTNIINTHLSTTTGYALQIARELNLSLSDKKILEMASFFHDYGKIFIPEEILHKEGKLTPEEREIMNLHSELGYEMLSKSGINKRVLDLIKDHHSAQSSDELLTQILSVADIYSALREERCYKAPMSSNEAFEILDQKAKKGEVSAEVVNALKSTVYKEERVA